MLFSSLSLVLLSGIVAADSASLSPSTSAPATPSPTTLQTSTTSAAKCKASCKLGMEFTLYSWTALEVTTEIVAATILYIVDSSGATETVTKRNPLPSNIELPPTNTDGTQIATLTYAAEFNVTTTKVLAYPTSFVAYPAEYSWAGTLPTTDAAGDSTCSTGTATMNTVPLHVPTTTQGAPPPPASDDPKGYVWSLATETCFTDWVQPTLTVPNHAALDLCTTKPHCPQGISAQQTALLLTETSTSHR
ncbi:hypothetical protein EJ06DRAFT_394128 [Trichodelitschia bisporula]|uniref:Uncharacterized protein n=1 Tax=Trichodelitschia bisporula TaxID=703511 RepID=A0A6G1HZN4_9PEZI|nr:hypothetical protein EJ06DRAFT_394128 [Trichodelitschia bisporula]